MIAYDRKKYPQAFVTDEDVRRAEAESGVRCLFGGACATWVIGIQNYFSDFDFYLFYETDSEKRGRRQFERETYRDFLFLPMETLLSRKELYPAYPSILNRGKETPALNHNYHRDDFLTTQKLFEIFLSDYIWDSGYLKKNADALLNAISVLDVLDYYFSRAYGNLNAHLRRGEAEAVRILRAFIGVAYMSWVLEKNTVPNADIHVLIPEYAPQPVADWLWEVLDKNSRMTGTRSADMHTYNVGTDDLFSVDAAALEAGRMLVEKPRLMMTATPEFMDFMQERLSAIADEMARNAPQLAERKLQRGNAAFAFREGIL